MTSPALRKLLGPKKKAEPRRVQWIKLNRNRCYDRLVIPPCFACGNATAEVVWFLANAMRGFSVFDTIMADAIRCERGLKQRPQWVITETTEGAAKLGRVLINPTAKRWLGCAAQRPLLGVKRTWRGLVSMSANDP